MFFCERRALAPHTMCSTLATFIGIKTEAHVLGFYSDFYCIVASLSSKTASVFLFIRNFLKKVPYDPQKLFMLEKCKHFSDKKTFDAQMNFPNKFDSN